MPGISHFASGSIACWLTCLARAQARWRAIQRLSGNCGLKTFTSCKQGKRRFSQVHYNTSKPEATLSIRLAHLSLRREKKQLILSFANTLNYKSFPFGESSRSSNAVEN